MVCANVLYIKDIEAVKGNQTPSLQTLKQLVDCVGHDDFEFEQEVIDGISALILNNIEIKCLYGPDYFDGLSNVSTVQRNENRIEIICCGIGSFSVVRQDNVNGYLNLLFTYIDKILSNTNTYLETEIVNEFIRMKSAALFDVIPERIYYA